MQTKAKPVKDAPRSAQPGLSNKGRRDPKGGAVAIRKHNVGINREPGMRGGQGVV
jgi:hypothetical protein